ncbi:hypothetical protein V1460_21380 [Streptomyces sp. SCSIO 30461]|uniref:hypothetical protein n=1 Tax=Streptomyces sp. SCSIO 30461 TaxID=3118085 RepID=UPI0030CBD52A
MSRSGTGTAVGENNTVITGIQNVHHGLRGPWVVVLALLTVLALTGGYYLLPRENTGENNQPQDPQKAGEEPFHVAVRQVWDLPQDGTFWVFPERLSAGSLHTPSDQDQRASRQYASLGGIRGGRNCGEVCTSVSRYHVTLTGNRLQPVHIDAIRAKVLSKKAAPSGTFVCVPPQGGGPADTVYIDLDSSRKDGMEVDKHNTPTTRIFADGQNRYAAQGEPLDFIVIGGTAEPSLYTWELELELSYDGRQETQTIRLKDNKPFQTVGWLGVPAYDVVYVQNPTGKLVESGEKQPKCTQPS